MEFARLLESVDTVVTGVPPGSYSYEQARGLIRYLHSSFRHETLVYSTIEIATNAFWDWKIKLAPYQSSIQVSQQLNTVTLSLVIFEPAVNGMS